MNFNDVEKKKSSSIINHNNHLRIAANAFRLLEICLAIALFFWISAQLPVAVRIFVEYSSQILRFVTRPLVVFVFFNAIVAAVAASKSARLGQTPIDASYFTDDDFYQEIMVKVNESRSAKSSSSSTSSLFNNYDDEEIIIFQDKQIILSSTTPPAHHANSGIIGSSEIESSSGSEKVISVMTPPKVYRRTKSEKISSSSDQSQGRQLRRSETTKLRKRDHRDSPSDDDAIELSSDEFQREIEEFIAKQLRFRREESMAIVLK